MPCTASLHAAIFKAVLLCLQMKDVGIENLNYDDLEAVAHLKGSARYQDIMQVSHIALSQAAGLLCPCSSSLCMHVLDGHWPDFLWLAESMATLVLVTGKTSCDLLSPRLCWC